MNDFWTFVKLNREMITEEIFGVIFGICKVLFVIASVFLVVFTIINLPLVWFIVALLSLITGFFVSLRISSLYNGYKIYTKENSSIPRNTLK